MTEERFVRICPTAEELDSASEYFCTEDACLKAGLKFRNESNLEMHLTRHHKFSTTRDHNIKRQFHCPVLNCVYNIESTQLHSFSSRKYLKQHYQKVHAKKEFECCICQKNFATIVLRENHERTCGNYPCPQCHYTYKSRETLLSHVRRKHNGNVSSSGLKRNRQKGVQNKQKLSDAIPATNNTLEVGTQANVLEAPPQEETLIEERGTDTATYSDTQVDNYCQTNYFDDTFGCFNPPSTAGGTVSSIETQTDLLDDLSLMSTIYQMNDRHTQTCDEILSDLLVNDIETQTVMFPDGLNNSIQTQTVDVFFGATSTSSTQT